MDGFVRALKSWRASLERISWFYLHSVWIWFICTQVEWAGQHGGTGTGVQHPKYPCTLHRQTRQSADVLLLNFKRFMESAFEKFWESNQMHFHIWLLPLSPLAIGNRIVLLWCSGWSSRRRLVSFLTCIRTLDPIIVTHVTWRKIPLWPVFAVFSHTCIFYLQLHQ